MQLVKIQNPNQLTDIIHSLVAGSFEKKFKNIPPADVINAFAFATQGLSQEQLNTGIMILMEKAFCPDPALFRQWCLGNRDFKFDDTDHINDSYVGKSGALANILLWLKDNKTQITKAQKQAYDKTAHLFYDIKYNPKLELTAHLAFMDNYEQIVRELVVSKIICEVYTPPIAIDTPKQKVNAKSTNSANDSTAHHYINELFGQLGMKNKIKTQGS